MKDRLERVEIFGREDGRIMVQETFESAEFFYPLHRNARTFKRRQPKIYVERLRLVEASQ